VPITVTHQKGNPKEKTRKERKKERKGYTHPQKKKGVHTTLIEFVSPGRLGNW
jgi:hypothetical protein